MVCLTLKGWHVHTTHNRQTRRYQHTDKIDGEVSFGVTPYRFTQDEALSPGLAKTERDEISAKQDEIFNTMPSDIRKLIIKCTT